MSDDALFIVAPYVAAASLVVFSLVRFALLRDWIAAARTQPSGVPVVHAIWRWAIAFVLLGHLLAIAFPGPILMWNRQPLRLLVLEGAGLLAGVAALLGLLAAALQRHSTSARVSPLQVIVTTLASVQVGSGIAVAVLYRWASSWSEVTLTPYVRSLLLTHPAVVLVADMPALVRLHVFCAFAVVAALPFTRSADLAFAFLHQHRRPMASRVAHMCAPAWRFVDTRRTKHVQLVQSLLLRDHDRDN